VCETCPPHHIVSQDGISCHLPTCDPREMITEYGECEMCAEYESVISSKLECEEPVCESRKKITIDGTCELCEDFMIPSEYGYECY